MGNGDGRGYVYGVPLEVFLESLSVGAGLVYLVVLQETESVLD